MSPQPVKYLIKSIKFRNKTSIMCIPRTGERVVLLLLLIVVSSCLVQVTSASGSCPSVCNCKWKGGKETAECTDKSLISIPENIDPGTQVLDISNNNLQILPREIFRRSDLLNLQKIYLRDCRLGQIDRAAFAGLTNLVELDLSHNLLTSIPTASLSELPSLRDLILTSNSIQKIDERAFAPVPHLVKLDLSNCGIQTVTPRAFEGLQALHTLKLNGNKLSDLRAKTIETLGKLRGIELHDNPWVCDCRLRAAKIWLTDNNIPFTVAPVCAGGPERVIQHTFSELGVDEFACKPEMGVMNRIVEAGSGENASITCRAAGIPSPRISWYWNGRALVNNTMHNAHQRIHIYEFGVSEKRSTLTLTNAQETDSSEFYCVAENPAGTTEANFTLHVSLRAAGIRTLGEKQIAGLSAALVILILFILLITGFLLVRLRRIPISESKTPGQMEVITSVSPANVIANGKVQCGSPVHRDDPSSPDRKINDLKSGTNPIQKPPRLTDLPYSTNNYDGNGSVILPPLSTTGGFGSPTASGNNPDLINDTRVTGSGSNLAGIDTQLVTNSQSTTIQMANLLAEMQLQHHQLQQASQALLQQQQQQHHHPSESSSGDYSRAGGCDSLYPSGLWTGSREDPNLTNLLLNAHQMNGYTNSCYSTDKIMNNYQHQQQQQPDEEMSTTTADYLSKTFPRTSLGSNNNSLLTNSYHHTLSSGGAGGASGGGYPVDYGLPIVPGAEQRSVVGGSVHNNNPMSNSTPPMNAKTLRVWQKGGVPVLPPVTALKRALTNSRNSPDEGYQEGCGTDV